MKKNYLDPRICFLALAFILSLPNVFGQAVTTLTFNYTGSVQNFTVPVLCVNSITIDARGAQGGSFGQGTGGLGARIAGAVTVTPGMVLQVYVGGQGVASQNAGGGGGGSGVGNGATPFMVAGGGGGACTVNNIENGQAGQITNNGGNSSGLGGTAGNGGQKGYISGDCGWAGGGGGWLGDGYGGPAGGDGGALPGTLGGPAGGKGRPNGGFGGVGGSCGFSASGSGGWGCGGGGRAEYGGGGGGGYSGGGGGQYVDVANERRGGGGGSFNGGTNQINTSGFQSGNGVVIISYVSGNAITVSASPSIICTGGASTLTAGGVSTYTWSTGSNATTVSVSPTSNTTYTVTGSDVNGCTSSLTINVPVDQSVPNLTLTQSATSVCATKPVTLTASGALTYTWTNGVTNGVSYVPSATSDYTVTGGNACGTSTAVTSVTVLTLPSVSATASSPSVCSGGTVILSGSGATGYTWNPNVGNNTTFTPQTTTNYTVTGLGANGCTNTAVVNVLVLVTPTIAPVATPTAICVGATSTISALGAIGYSWTAPNFAGSNNFSVAVSPTVTTTYTLERANGTCTSTTLLNVVVNNLPILFLSPPSTVCACTGSAALTVVGGITYTWFPSGASGSQLTVYPCSTTNYTVGASNSFCSTYSTVLVTTSPNPTITITPTSPSICVGGTVGLTAGGAPNFTWTTQPVATILPNNAIITDTPAQSKLYTATGSSTAGCVASAAQVIIVNPNPNLIVTSSNPFVCNGALTTLSAVNSVTQNPAPTVSYSWSTNQITPSISVNPTISTNYTVSGTYTTGCKTTSVYPLTVYIATFVVNTPSALCSGSTATLTATGAATNFVWGTIPVQTSSVALVSPTLTTVYTVTGTTGQCSVVKTVTVPINPIPPVSITTPKWVICLFDGADLTANGALTYTWNTGEVGPSINFTTTGNGGPNGNPTTTTSFTVTGTDVNGCAKTVSATVFVSNCTGVDELNGSVNNHLEIYPNPNNGNFVVKADAPVQLTIINELGQNIRNVELTETLKEVNVTGLANGVYFIMGQNNGTRIAKKIVVNN